MNWEDGILFCLNKWPYFTTEFFMGIYILQVKIKTIPYFSAREKWWLNNFGSADCVFKMYFTWWSSVVALLIGKIYVSCQVGYKKVVYCFDEKSNFRYHLLAKSDSRPSSAHILSLLVPWITPAIAKHACIFYSFYFWFKFCIIRFVIYYICII